jgi:hypothetical protein
MIDTATSNYTQDLGSSITVSISVCVCVTGLFVGRPVRGYLNGIGWHVFKIMQRRQRHDRYLPPRRPADALSKKIGPAIARARESMVGTCGDEWPKCFLRLGHAVQLWRSGGKEEGEGGRGAASMHVLG